MKEQTSSFSGPFPLVTVAMCTYNGERFLDAQIESILDQTYSQLELIIVDDGSTDQTLSKIRKWMDRDVRVQLFQNEVNLGYNRNFEKAITLGSGTYIAISDQDDLWHPQKLEKVVAVFQDPDVVMVHSAAASIRDNLISSRSAQKRHHFQGSDPKPLFFTNQISGHAMVFRRDLLSFILPIPEGMYYDWWIAVTAACNGKVKAIDECLVMHRLHSQNAFFQKEKQEVKAKPQLLEMLNIFTGINGLKREDKAFLQQFSLLLVRHRKEKPFFNFSLFCFLWKYRKTFFGYKKRSFQTFTYIKYSLLYAHKQM